jgi:hypothetical protein
MTKEKKKNYMNISMKVICQGVYTLLPLFSANISANLSLNYAIR